MCRTHWFPSSDGKFAKEVFAFLQSDPACWNTVNIVTHVADVSADSLPSKTDVSPVCPASACRLQSGLLTSMGDLEYFRIPLSRTKKRCRGNKHKNKWQEGHKLNTNPAGSVNVADSMQMQSLFFYPCLINSLIVHANILWIHSEGREDKGGFMKKGIFFK